MNEKIVFAKGEHEVETKYGTAKVIVPTDVKLCDFIPALHVLYEGRKSIEYK